jgi:hypothetical protein
MYVHLIVIELIAECIIVSRPRSDHGQDFFLPTSFLKYATYVLRCYSSVLCMILISDPDPDHGRTRNP